MTTQLRIVIPSAELLTPKTWLPDMAVLVETCGRISHKSEDAMGPGSFEKFIPKVAHKLGHESITEHIQLTVRIIGSRAMSHQLVRHRIAAYTQESQRYCDYSNDEKVAAMNIIVPPSIMAVAGTQNPSLNASNWRGMHDMRIVRLPRKEMPDCGQPTPPYPAPIDSVLCYVREGQDDPLPIYVDVDGGVAFVFFNSIMTSYESYLFLRDHGIPPEDSRFVLPNASKTEVAATYNIRTWRHVFRMRCDKHAQWEIRMIMQEILKMFIELLPVFFKDQVGLLEP